MQRLQIDLVCLIRTQFVVIEWKGKTGGKCSIKLVEMLNVQSLEN